MKSKTGFLSKEMTGHIILRLYRGCKKPNNNKGADLKR
jgi:hypothetical protein